MSLESLIAVIVENNAYSLKVCKVQDVNKIWLRPFQGKAEMFLKIPPEKFGKAMFILESNTQSEEAQKRALEEIEQKIRKKRTTGNEGLNYLLQLKVPEKGTEVIDDVTTLMQKKEFGLIHGGVGTAKTTELLNGVEEIVLKQKKPVLIIAPQHVIADEITLRAAKMGMPVLRCGNVPERFSNEVRENFARQSKKAFTNFLKKFSEINSKEGEMGCLLTATTMGGSFDWLISMLKDPQSSVYLKDLTLVIDEAALINYPELITAVYLLNPRALFLAGDHIQYKPYKISAKLKKREDLRRLQDEMGNSYKTAVYRYERSIFEQLLQHAADYDVVRLTKNFRNHWIVVELIRNLIDDDADLTLGQKEVLKENVITSKRIQGGENKITFISLVRSRKRDKDYKENRGVNDKRSVSELDDEETIVADPALTLVSITRAKGNISVIGNRETLEALTIRAKTHTARNMYSWIFDFEAIVKERLRLMQDNPVMHREKDGIFSETILAQSV